MSKSICTDELTESVQAYLTEYGNLADTQMRSAVRKSASLVRREIRDNAPKKTGAYRSSWRTRQTAKGSHTLTITVYSKNRYYLAHLLENGHANRTGGRTKAFPHIQPARDKGEKKLIALLKKNL